MSKTERIYALLVEANPVPDPDVLPERLVETEPHLRVIDPRREPMQTEETIQRDMKPSRRALIPALAVAAVVVAVIAAGVLLFTAGDEPDVADDREQSAVGTIDAFYAAVNSGDVEAIPALLSADGSLPEADLHMYEANAIQTASYPYQATCEATDANVDFVYVDCAVVHNDPVFVAHGASELIARYWVYDDGRVTWHPWEGAPWGRAVGSYRDYLLLNLPEEYAAVCDPLVYPVGSINGRGGGLALTQACYQLATPLAGDIAEWVDAGKPES